MEKIKDKKKEDITISGYRGIRKPEYQKKMCSISNLIPGYPDCLISCRGLILPGVF